MTSQSVDKSKKCKMQKCKVYKDLSIYVSPPLLEGVYIYFAID